MYDRLLALWVSRKATTTTLDNAVAKGWITAEQEATILATPQNPT